jgi:restriction endonuclease Mrr
MDGLLSLSPPQFEAAIALMLTAHGYHIVQRYFPNYPSDLRFTSPEGRATLVWCRRFRPGKLIGSTQVTASLGAVSMSGPSSLAMIVTTSGYTGQALELAKRYAQQIRLLDGQDVISMMQHVPPP